MTVSGIDITAPSPRVNFKLLEQYIGKRVKLVAKPEEKIEGGALKVRTSDDGIVEVFLKGDKPVPTSTFIEIDGTVESPNTIREESSTAFGDSFGT